MYEKQIYQYVHEPKPTGDVARKVPVGARP